VSHAATRWSSETGNERNDRLLGSGCFDEVGGLLLGGASNLSDEEDALRLVVIDELLEAVDEVGSVEWISSDSDDSGLAEAVVGGLVHGLVGEGAGTGDNTDTTLSVDVPMSDKKSEV